MNEENTKLKIALPRKGRISQSLNSVCKEAGYGWPSSDTGRALFAKISNDIEVMFVRTSDVPTVVADGIVDIGITGTDLVEESQCDVNIIEELKLLECRLVLAGTEIWAKSFNNNSKETIRIATSFPRLAQNWADQNDIKIQIIPLAGSVEIAPRIELADAIIDLTQTGASLKMNGLLEVETIRNVSTCIISSSGFDINNKGKVETIAKTFTEAIVSVLNARDKRYLMMNVPKVSLEEVKQIVPGLSAPTVLDLYGNSDIVALHVVIEASQLNIVIPLLREKGVHGILVTPIERLIP